MAGLSPQPLASVLSGSSSSTVTEHLYKVLVIGEFGVGKTSLIRRYTEGYFSPNYKLTIGVDFALKSLDWNNNIKVNLQLWDIAGHERFGHMTRVYYKYAIAAIIVYDLSRPATFDSVLKWLEDVNSKVVLSNDQPVPVMLLANKGKNMTLTISKSQLVKLERIQTEAMAVILGCTRDTPICDLEDGSYEEEKLNTFCKERHFIGWFKTSAKTNHNVDEAMNFLVTHILSLPNGAKQASDHTSLSGSIMSELEESYFDGAGENRKDNSCCNT